MTVLWIILAIVSFSILLCGVISAFKNNNVPLAGIILLVFSIATSICVVEANRAYENRPKYPTALDVYRGKTTLEITYRDGVAVDSVVVYKMK